MADQNPGGLPNVELPLLDDDMVLISRDGVGLKKTTYGALSQQISDASLDLFNEDLTVALSSKLDASAADDFATSDQGSKADKAITFDAVENNYKKPDGSVVTLGARSRMSTGKTLLLTDSRGRWAVTDNSNSDTIGANYSDFDYLKFYTKGRLKLVGFTGNQGYDIKETYDDLEVYPPCNTIKSFDGSGTNRWGWKGIDLNEVEKVIVVLGINHFPSFNFTAATFDEREATNAVARQQIETWAIQLLSKLATIGDVEWKAELPVGPATTNFNSGNLIKGGFVWHLKWFNNTLLPKLCKLFPFLRIRDYSDLIVDQASALYQARIYGMLSSDGSQANQDPHPTGWTYRTVCEAWANDLEPELRGLPMGIPMSASEKIGVSQDNYNVIPDSLLLGATIPAKVVYGPGTGTTIAVADAYISGPMYPEMAVQVNQVSPVIVPGNFNILTKLIPSPSGAGNAIQADFTANVAFDGSIGFRSYIVGAAINAAIASGFLTLDEEKIIQACCYFVAGLAGASDGKVTKFDSLRQFANQARVRMGGNNYFSTVGTYGLANNLTDFSGVTGTAAITPGSAEGVQTTAPSRMNGITPGTPRTMAAQTMAAPNTNEYLYFYVSAKLQAGQTARLIIGNFGCYVAPMPANGLITDII